jgi:hypothetical protein
MDKLATRATLFAVTAVVTLSVAGVVAASTIIGTREVSATVRIVAPPEPDVDQDGCVGEKDLFLVAANIGKDELSPSGADVDKNGRVDVLDAAFVGQAFGTRTSGEGPCP